MSSGQETQLRASERGGWGWRGREAGSEHRFKSLNTRSRGEWLGVQPQAEVRGRGFSGQFPRSPAHSPGIGVSGRETPWRLARPPSCQSWYLLPRTFHSNETALFLSPKQAQPYCTCTGPCSHLSPFLPSPPGPRQPPGWPSEALMPKMRSGTSLSTSPLQPEPSLNSVFFHF